jgi:predicted transcriptional regulator
LQFIIKIVLAFSGQKDDTNIIEKGEHQMTISDRRDFVKNPGEYQEEVDGLIKYGDGSYEAVVINNMNDEAYLRPATEAEIRQEKKLLELEWTPSPDPFAWAKELSENQ